MHSVAIADYFIWLMDKEHKNLCSTGIDIFYLQRLLFYAYGYYLIKYNRKLFSEGICTWGYCTPLEPKVLYTKLEQNYDYYIGEVRYNSNMSYQIKNIHKIEKKPKVKETLLNIWKICKQLTPDELIKNIEVGEGSSFYSAWWYRKTDKRYIKVSDNTIKQDFERFKYLEHLSSLTLAKEEESAYVRKDSFPL